LTIGIVTALEEEMKPLIQAIDAVEESKWGKKSVYRGVVGDGKVVLIACGVGKVKAAACTQQLIDRFAVEAVISCGVAGAVNPRLTIGDIVVSKRALQHDFDSGDPELLKKLRKRWLKADPKLMKLAMEAGEDLGLQGRIHHGSVLTGDQAILSEEKRQWLWETFRGDCVEMEGAAVAKVCQLNNVPFLIVRAISDSATEEAEGEFKQSLARAAVDAAEIVLAMLVRLR
jgi:adenosylhomocysteine nucleosidase